MGRDRRPWYREGKGWWFVTINGKQVRLVAGKANRREAERIFREKVAELERAAAEAVDGSDATVGDLYDGFLAWSQRNNSPETVDEKLLRLADFAVSFKGTPARDIRPAHVAAWVESHPSWTSAWTRGNAVKYVKSMFNHAVREGLLERNPLAGLTCERGGSHRPLTRAEYGKLTRAARHGIRTGTRATSGRRFRELLFFLRHTGARPGEVRALQWHQVDLAKGVACLVEHKTSKKTGKPRLIVLTPAVVKVLGLIAARDGRKGTIFATSDRKPWSRCGVSQRFRQLRERAGLPDECVPYGLRHAYGTNGIVNGVDPLTLATLMGHTTARMTERYVHLSDQSAHLADAAAKVTRRRRAGRSE